MLQGEEDIRCQVPPSFWGPWRPTWSAHFSSPYPRPYPPTCYFSELLGLPGGNILANRKSYSRENAKPPSVPPLKAHPSGASRQGQLDGLPSPHQSPNDIQGLHMTLDPFGNAFGPEALRSDDQVAAPLYGATVRLQSWLSNSRPKSKRTYFSLQMCTWGASVLKIRRSTSLRTRFY